MTTQHTTEVKNLRALLTECRGRRIEITGQRDELLAALENLYVLAAAFSDEPDWQIEEALTAITKAKGSA